VGTDPDSDLAVVKFGLPADRLHPIEMADSTRVKAGQLAVAIGKPFALEGTMTVGFVSALGRSLPADHGDASGLRYSIPDIIQTDARIARKQPKSRGDVTANKTGHVASEFSSCSRFTSSDESAAHRMLQDLRLSSWRGH